MMRASIFLAIAALVTLVGGKQPNILFVILDDIGWNDVGYQHSGFATPNLDTLAKGGVRVTNYYVQPVCSPTRSSFLTGKYPYRMGLQHLVLLPACKAGIPPGDPTLSELLKGTGYSTHAIGKWHCGYSSWHQTPTGRGFDSHLGYFQAMQDYYNKSYCYDGKVGDARFCGYDFWRDRQEAWRGSGQNYSTELYREEAMRIFKHQGARVREEGEDAAPFFMQLAFQTAHDPLEAPPNPKYMKTCAHLTSEKRRTYCAMILNADNVIGEVVETLKGEHLWNNTIMIVTTDNGGMVQAFPDTALASAGSNYPLRGGKATLFEGGVKAVGFVNSPLLPRHRAGKNATDLMHCSDWLPTLLGLTGARDKMPKDIDGVDQWPMIIDNSTKPARTEVVLNIDGHRPRLPIEIDESKISEEDRNASLRFQQELAILGWPEELGKQTPIPPDVTGIRVGDWKLVLGHQFYDGWYPPLPQKRIPEPPSDKHAKVYLFNVEEDPNEHHNMATSNPTKVNELLKRLQWHYDNQYVKAQNLLPDPFAFPYWQHGSWAPYRK